jgi:HAE1 family hydrophobic/amphiphilic exporter-1
VKIADTSIRRPVFAVMVIGGLVAMGLISIPRVGVDLFPRVEFPMVTVTTVLRGAAPETVEREVTEIIEESVNTIEGVRALRSYSSESISRVMIEFELDEDAREKTNDVRDKVFAARAKLPDDTEPPVVERIDAEAEPILSVLVSGPQAIRELTEFADKRLRPRLERLDGVGSVTIVGGRARAIRIWLDPIRLAGYDLAVDDVIATLKRGHVELPGGRIETPRHEYSVKTRGKVERAEDFGALVVAERSGRAIQLRDVATVEDGMADERTIARLDGRRGVSLLVRRQSGENIVAVAQGVKRALRELAPSLPAGMEMVVAQDTSRFIESSVRDVAQDLLWGGLLAVLVVLAFLRSGRATLIAATAIPTSLFASFTLFYFMGFTLNNMTLMALSLSIGMLIDDAIVVLENIWRHIEGGRRPMEAASVATREIGLAVIATTLAICAVFVPIAFMGSMIGKFFREFGLVVACAVCVSTLVAVTLTPMLCSRYLRPGEAHGGAYRLLERLFVSLEARYRAALAWGLDHRRLVVVLAFGSVLLSGAIATRVPFEFMPAADRSEFNVWLKMPLGTPLERTSRTTRSVEEMLRQAPYVTDVFARVGGGANDRANEARLYVKLTHKTERDTTQAEVMGLVRQRLQALHLPLEDYAVEDIPWIEVAGARQSMVNYALRGPDLDRLGTYADEIVRFMEGAGGFTDVASSYESGKPEISLDVSRARAADLGVDVAQIGATISALLGGAEVATFEEHGERWDVRLQLHPSHRDDPLEIGLVNVRARDGRIVPLANLVRPTIASGPVQVDRENRSRVVNLQANLDGKALGEAAREIEAFAAGLGMEDGYELAPIGNTEMMKETVAAIAFAFLLAMLAMYMILASQFNSFLHPATIMLSAPLSFIGAFAALWLGGYYLDMMTQIGLLMLMGLVMKNGILLVDYTNTLRDVGMPLREAVLEAGPKRLRPVLMTAISTIFGMLPVALGRGDGAEWRSSMGAIVIGGMAASTLLTLLVVPVAYTLVDDLQRSVERALQRLTAREPERIAPPRAG